MDRNVTLVHQAAKCLHLPYKYYPKINFLEIHLGKKRYYFHHAITPLNYGASAYISVNKYINNALLAKAGFPVAKAVTFSKESWRNEPLAELIKKLQFPLVAKPLKNTARGHGVFCKIPDIKSLANYLDLFFQHFEDVEIEEFHGNLKEYRILILKNKVIGVLERVGASVIGDGKHTIDELIAIKNKEKILLSQTVTISPMTYDLEYELCLKEQGLKLQSIPSNGQKIRLCYTANTGRGGDINSLGNKIHPQNAAMLIKAARALGLEYTGLDMFCTDINVPFHNTNKWLIIEANIGPDMTLHELTPQGKKIAVSNIVIWELIKRHPFAYLYHLATRSPLSFYFKASISIAILLILLSSFK